MENKNNNKDKARDNEYDDDSDTETTNTTNNGTTGIKGAGRSTTNTTNLNTKKMTSLNAEVMDLFQQLMTEMRGIKTDLTTEIQVKKRKESWQHNHNRSPNSASRTERRDTTTQKREQSKS